MRKGAFIYVVTLIGGRGSSEMLRVEAMGGGGSRKCGITMFVLSKI